MPGLTDRLYGEVFRRALQPTWETRLRGRPTLAYLAKLEQTQWASRDELEAMQLAALQKLLRHAWHNVPLYRTRMDQAGLGPDGLRSLDDLRRLPVLTREQASEQPDARLSIAPPMATMRKTTSGSTGRPLAFGYDQDSEYWRQAVKLRGYGWAGYRPGDPTLHFWGAVAKKASLRVRTWVTVDRRMRRETFVDCGRRGERELNATVALIRARRPSVLVCYAQAVADLARWVNEKGLRDWDTIPVICGAEKLFDTDRAAIEQAFGKAVFETYGSREVMLIATETDAHDGLLVQMENLVVELLVKDAAGNYRPAEPGEAGEVVLTDLHNLGMPFIRYVNGDMAVAGPKSASACGRQHQRLASIEGRVTETLTDAQGARVNGLVFNVMFSTLGNRVRQFQAVQHKDLSVTLRVVPNHAFDEPAKKIIHATAAKYLNGLPFTLQIVDEIAVSASGKRHVLVVEK